MIGRALTLSTVSEGCDVKRVTTRPGVDKVKPKVLFKYSFEIDYWEQGWTVPPCSYLLGSVSPSPLESNWDFEQG